MVKNFFQDMIKMKSDLRKEREGNVAPTSAPAVETPPSSADEGTWPPTVASKVTRRISLAPAQDQGRRPWYSIWLVAGISLVFLFFSIFFLFSEAFITINPKVKDVTFKQNLSANETPAEGNLSFDVVVLSGVESKTVEGGEMKNVSVAARGTVLIYNNYSSATQRLDINTRLEGSNGKLYQTEKAVVVPGLNGTTPGSVEVGIYAAEAGEAYNSPPLDFQIFGFKGMPKYNKFYARSKGEITGGFIGKQSVITEAKKSIIQNEMKETLKVKLAKKAADLVPAGFVMFKDAVILNVDSVNFETLEGGQLQVNLKGTFSGIIFNESELIKKIIKSGIPDYDNSDVYISNFQDLNFVLLDTKGNSSSPSSVDFNLSGKPKVVWRVDTDRLVAEVVGKSKKDFYQILAQYPNVESANVLLRPFWKRGFPGDKSDIKVTVNYPQ